MKFSTKTTALENTPTSCLVLGVFEDGVMTQTTAAMDKVSQGYLGKIIASGDISGKSEQSLLLHGVPNIKARRLLLIGCGNKEKLKDSKFISLLRNTGKALEQYSIGDALLALGDLDIKNLDAEHQALLIARTFQDGLYRYRSTRSKPTPDSKLKSLDIYLSDKSQQTTVRKGLNTGAAIGRGMAMARELGNLPGNICTPSYLAEQALKLGKAHKELKVTVLSEAQMKRLGMGSLLSVSAGSVQPAKFIIMEYRGTAADTPPHVLVGKGITFDSGGISLKPGAGMDEMKFDMCGAASVLGTFSALCELKPELKPRCNIVGLVASAENMPGSSATKPGDIVTSMSGQTIEVLNTDAEGRLVLCDALTYAERFKPASVIDIATLTGACIVALGSHVSALMSNDDTLADALYQCGLKAVDPVWRLPLWDEYQKQLDSNFADIANIGGPKAGSITAACFLSRFAKKYHWAHLDIAGTAWLQGKEKGATGRPVPLLLEYLLQQQK
ncbi:MAG: leucyl aminopeptidase [Pseudomonadales bacterium]|nr:leucyl aminopeptidase [Pseudomonadales bacterium]